MIDCFPFFNELDVLEIRLRTLAPYVERFILAECVKTHSGKDKPLFYADNKARFKDFNITHVIIPPKVGEPWELEAYGRECLLKSIEDGDPEEIVLISDVDEIPDLNTYSGEQGVFQNKVYKYQLDNFVRDDWKGTFAIKRKNIGRFCIDHKEREKFKRKANVVGYGNHYSSIGTLENLIYKIESFAHQEFNTEDYKNKLKCDMHSVL